MGVKICMGLEEKQDVRLDCASNPPGGPAFGNTDFVIRTGEKFFHPQARWCEILSPSNALVCGRELLAVFNLNRQDVEVNELAVGSIIGQYKIVRRLGQGSMGVVYEAIDKKLSQCCGQAPG